METPPIQPALAWLLIASFTGGGVWFVIRLIIRFQRDFTDSYALRNAELEAENELLRRELHQAEHNAISNRIELGAARVKLRSQGIPWSRADWDEHTSEQVGEGR